MQLKVASDQNQMLINPEQNRHLQQLKMQFYHQTANEPHKNYQ